MRAIRQWAKRHPVISVIIVVLVGLVILSLIGGYFFNWNWTGFGSYTSPPHQKDSDFQREKTLWDWLQLLGVLAIPVVVGLGTVWFTTQQGKVSDAENRDNQREAALQGYLDKISELLLDHDLRKSEGKEAQNIALARTAAVMHTLDARRLAILIRFLSKSGLIAICTGNKLPRIDLHQTNLLQVDLNTVDLVGTNLNHSDLRDANLSRAFLVGANLNGANLSKANLQRIDLRDANLTGANIYGADLHQANLGNANLTDANLTGANLTGANLTKARVTQEQLRKAASFEGTIGLDTIEEPYSKHKRGDLRRDI